MLLTVGEESNGAEGGSSRQTVNDRTSELETSPFELMALICQKYEPIGRVGKTKNVEETFATGLEVIGFVDPM